VHWVAQWAENWVLSTDLLWVVQWADAWGTDSEKLTGVLWVVSSVELMDSMTAEQWVGPMVDWTALSTAEWTAVLKAALRVGNLVAQRAKTKVVHSAENLAHELVDSTVALKALRWVAHWDKSTAAYWALMLVH
jgi:hypothetical protein